MSEAREYIIKERNNGSVQISEDVIGAIAASAVKEVEGVYSLSASFSSDIAALLGKKTDRGIKLVLGENSVAIEVNIIVRYNHQVVEVAKSVQEAVAQAVADMTDIEVDLVNVNVTGIAIPKATQKK